MSKKSETWLIVLSVIALIVALILLAGGCALTPQLPDPTPDPPPFPSDILPLAEALPYDGAHWWNGAQRDLYGMLRTSPYMPEQNREIVDELQKDAKWVALVGYNERDGAHPIPLYTDTFGGTVNTDVSGHLGAVVARQRAGGRIIDWWLEVDDSPGSDRAPVSAKKANFDKQMAIKLPDGSRLVDNISMLTVDLESNEDQTLNKDSNLAALVAYCQQRLKDMVPDRFIPVMVHYNRTDSSRALRVGADGHHAQEDKSLSKSQLVSKLAPHIAKMHAQGKLLVAFEIGHNNDKAADIDKGAACIAAGADGTGSGVQHD